MPPLPPPPFPLIAATPAFIHSTPSISTLGGTPVYSITLLVAASTANSAMATVPIFSTCVTASRTAAASSMSVLTTQNLSPFAAAASAAPLAASTITALLPAAAFLAASRSTFCTSPSPALSAAFCTAPITALSSSTLIAVTVFSSSSPLSLSSAATATPSSAARALAAAAAPLVSPVMRRMPFAVPSSDSSTNASASPVLDRCVPPQNSVLTAPHLALSGSASRASTSAPTLTTRTGSG
mmetsp:Transcript_13097/g.22183  ORF Transcript_13097/g.22183 Transcript_13097/m.22183 type:complete len:240 (-) Transcript_13097:2745-3464(-)